MDGRNGEVPHWFQNPYWSKLNPTSLKLQVLLLTAIHWFRWSDTLREEFTHGGGQAAWSSGSHCSYSIWFKIKTVKWDMGDTNSSSFPLSQRIRTQDHHLKDHWKVDNTQMRILLIALQIPSLQAGQPRPLLSTTNTGAPVCSSWCSHLIPYARWTVVLSYQKNLGTSSSVCCRLVGSRISAT